MRFYTTEVIETHAAFRPKGYYKDLIESGTPLYASDGTMRGVMLSEEEHKSLATRYANTQAIAAVKPEGGPGTELKAMLKTFGITASPNCSCNAKAAQMDAWGPSKSRENLTEIVVWLQEEARKRKLPFSRLAARKLVEIAISRAERKAAKKS